MRFGFIILSWILIHQRLGRKESGFVHSNNVHIGEPNHFFQGFGPAIDIKVEGVDEEFLKAGHEVCWSYVQLHPMPSIYSCLP